MDSVNPQSTQSGTDLAKQGKMDSGTKKLFLFFFVFSYGLNFMPGSSPFSTRLIFGTGMFLAFVVVYYISYKLIEHDFEKIKPLLEEKERLEKEKKESQFSPK